MDWFPGDFFRDREDDDDQQQEQVTTTGGTRRALQEEEAAADASSSQPPPYSLPSASETFRGQTFYALAAAALMDPPRSSVVSRAAFCLAALKSWSNGEERRFTWFVSCDF